MRRIKDDGHVTDEDDVDVDGYQETSGMRKLLLCEVYFRIFYRKSVAVEGIEEKKETALDVHGKLHIRLRPDGSQNDTWIGVIEDPRRTNDDDIGALYYVVAVIFIYGLSIVMMIASHIRKNKQDSQLRTYLKEMSNLRKTERREKVLHKMTDLAKREKEKAEREAEAKRRLQEKLRLTGSGGESGDDTESDAATSAPTNQTRHQRRPLLAARRPTFGSSSPIGSVAAMPIKDEDEEDEDGGGGGSDVPSVSDSVFVADENGGKTEGRGDGRSSSGCGGDKEIAKGGHREKRDLSQSTSSSCCTPATASSPLNRSTAGSTMFYYSVPSSADRLSPSTAEKALERGKLHSNRTRSPSFHDYRRWMRPSLGSEPKSNRGAGPASSLSGQRSPGSSPSYNMTNVHLSPLLTGRTRSPAVHEVRTASKLKQTCKSPLSNDLKSQQRRRAESKHSCPSRRPVSVTVDSKSSFPASFYIVDEDAVL
ncbi:hypothetical protein PoB_000608600 [Plakobranchus ocellatus]|uniref:Uncharacterized protein n=1 Tax=Plakobranchus ocellatus TaxID=259542 RepID=A0AAV3XX76_9GAST|nr:hypothetical protein PoB_000608600 [Plakobranchus ocellatus]